MQKNKAGITTPIVDFVKKYANSEMIRFHMPGHKGKSFLGCEAFDITEISGADSLYEAEGIIAESERNATELFGSGKTLFSTEGSSQCIRAMLSLCLMAGREKSPGTRQKIAAARNVHKAFIYAATLLDFDVVWLWPQNGRESICSCDISKEQVAAVLEKYPDIAAVYVTSPDYLGGQLDLQGIAEICHERKVLLAVDNAHGAYLKFLESSRHPLDLGADICCDSAHKTLPVLTGGAYLHIGKNAPRVIFEQAKYAMNLFGSTSPSYLIMASLDLANRYLAEGYGEKLKHTIVMRNACCEQLRNNGWKILESDPLKITLEIPKDVTKKELTDKLREQGVECEYADRKFVVFMMTPENTEEDFGRLRKILSEYVPAYEQVQGEAECFVISTTQVMSIREAMFSLPETVPVSEAEERICRVPTVSCPPAIPIAVPGELITKELIALFEHYGITTLDVVANHFFARSS